MDSLADRLATLAPDAEGITRALRRAADDERRHHARCMEVLEMLGDDQPLPERGPSLPLSDSGDLRIGLLEHVAFLLCAGEAIAAKLLKAAAEGATVPEVVALLEEIAHDEKRHARLGWAVLDTVLALLDDEERALASTVVPRQVIRAAVAARAMGPADEHARAWGLLPGDEAFDIAKAVVSERIIPELRSRGVWASAPPGDDGGPRP